MTLPIQAGRGPNEFFPRANSASSETYDVIPQKKVIELKNMENPSSPKKRNYKDTSIWVDANYQANW